MGEVDLGKRFNADAWYAVIAAVLGLVSGTVVSWWRSRDPLLTTVLVLLGSGVAAGVMSVLGRLARPGRPAAAGRLRRGRCPARGPAQRGRDGLLPRLAGDSADRCLVVLWSPPTPPE